MEDETDGGVRPRRLIVEVSYPFCPVRCGFCDALVVEGHPAREPEDGCDSAGRRTVDFGREPAGGCGSARGYAGDPLCEAYCEALERQVVAEAPRFSHHELAAVRFTGGSPFFMGGDRVSRILAMLRASIPGSGDSAQPFVTMEGNTRGLIAENLGRYLDAGVNALQIGMMTFDDGEADELGLGFRSSELFGLLDLFHTARFTDFGISFLLGLPGQSLASLGATISDVVAAAPARVRIEPLRIAKGTRFYQKYGIEPWRNTDPRYKMPGRGELPQLYHRACNLLDTCGYHRYTAFDFARDDHRDALVLLEADDADVFSLGLGATSRTRDAAWTTTSDIDAYIEHAGEPDRVHVTVDVPSDDVRARRFLARCLYLACGISRREFSGHLQREGLSVDRDVSGGDTPGDNALGGDIFDRAVGLLAEKGWARIASDADETSAQPDAQQPPVQLSAERSDIEPLAAQPGAERPLEQSDAELGEGRLVLTDLGAVRYRDVCRLLEG